MKKISVQSKYPLSIKSSLPAKSSLLRRYMLLLVSLFLLAGLAESANYKDYPMISTYPGATLSFVRNSDNESFTFPASVVDTTGIPYRYSEIQTGGHLLQYLYEIKSAEPLDVYKSYSQTVKKLGFKVVFTCRRGACGNQFSSAALGELISINKNIFESHQNPYYLLAEKKTENGKVYAAWFIGDLNGNVSVQQTIVEAKPVEVAAR